MNSGGVAHYVKSLTDQLPRNIDLKIMTADTSYKIDTPLFYFDYCYNIFSLWPKIFNFKKISAKNFDIVHAHTQKAAFLVALAKTLGGNFAMIYTPHGLRHTQLTGIQKIFHYLLDKYIFHVSDKIIAISKSEHQQMLRMTSLKSKIVLINTRIEKYPENITAVDDPFFEKYKLENKNIILMLGEVYPRKNPELFIKTYKKTLDSSKSHDLFFLWVGGGKDLSYWKNFIKKYDYKNILFAGKLPHELAMKILKKSKILLATSQIEAFPIYILEAFMLGTPVLCNNYPTSSDIIDNNKTGILFNFNDPEDASTKLLKLFYDNILQKKLAKNAKQFFITNHAGLENFAADHYKIYKEILA